MLSDHVISIAGRTITVTTHDMFMICVFVLIGLVFLSIAYLSRKRVVVLKRSSGTSEIAFELSRIGNALERIADGPADRMIALAARRQQKESQAVSQGMPLSYAGR